MGLEHSGQLAAVTSWATLFQGSWGIKKTGQGLCGLCWLRSFASLAVVTGLIRCFCIIIYNIQACNTPCQYLSSRQTGGVLKLALMECLLIAVC